MKENKGNFQKEFDLLVDLMFVNSPGGLNLQNILLSKLSNRSNIFYVFDQRNSHLVKEFNIKKSNYIIVDSFINWILFYYRKRGAYKKIFMFGNIPPPYPHKNVIIYLQNILYLQNHKTFTKRWLKNLYFKFFIKKRYKIIVQTSNMKNVFTQYYKNSIDVFPFYKEHKQINRLGKTITYFYPATFLKYKNHDLLYSSFYNALKSTSKSMRLFLTIEDENFKILQKEYGKTPSIQNLGKISHEKVQEIYKKTHYVVFPSSDESFGLPIIEGIESNCKIIAPKLDYIDSICTPSLYFDLKIKSTLINAIVDSTEYEKTPFSKLTIRDMSNELIKKITKNVN